MQHRNLRTRVQTRLRQGNAIWHRFLIDFCQSFETSYSEFSELKDLILKQEYYNAYKRAEHLSTQSIDKQRYFCFAQFVALIKKYRDVSPRSQSLDPEHSARATWLASEERCRAINLDGYADIRDLSRYLGRMRLYVETVIGRKPDLESIYSRCTFSTGASIGVHGDRTNLARKYLSEVWTCTPSAWAHAAPALRKGRWIQDSDMVCDLQAPYRDLASITPRVRWVSGNKLAFVPKTMATHRPIAVEPLLNSFIQSGIDFELRDLLRERAGIDLRYQGPNQSLARHGSLHDTYATIDLSSASDSLSRRLVRDVLPYDWWALLESTRSCQTTDGTSIRTLDKFCSMGNNFCFPLQTLIFSAAAYAVGACKGSFRVYGDDIIVPSEYGQPLLALLQAIGFVPNHDKTFLSGPFRESCGADWWRGEPVRPAYCVRSWSDVRNLMSFHNTALRLWPDSWHHLLDGLRLSVPKAVRFVRPCDDTDGGAFNVPVDQAQVSPTVWWDREVYNWRWIEFRSRSVADDVTSLHGWEHVTQLAVLSGSRSDQPFSYRRKARTSIAKVSRWSFGPFSALAPTGDGRWQHLPDPASGVGFS